MPANIQAYIQGALAIIGCIYVILSIVGSLFPTTAVGQWCRKIAADIKALFPPAVQPQQMQKPPDAK